MATHTFNLFVDLGQLSCFPTSVDVEPNDTVEFLYLGNDGSFAPIEIAPPPSLFTSAATINLTSPSDSISRVVASNATGTYDFAGLTSPTLVTEMKVVVDEGVNDTPNPFFFAPVVNVERSTVFISNEITVSGIDVTISASISGSSGQFSINGGSFSATTRSVSNGDKIRLRLTSSADWQTTRTTTLNLNGVTGSWSVTTAAEPVFLIIPFSVTQLPILFSQVRDFYGIGAASQSWGLLTQYVRGGPLVPDISQNAHVPTNTPMNLASLVGTSHAAFWENRLVARNHALNPSVIQEHTFYWHLNEETDPEGNPYIGYGLARRLLQFRWRFRPESTPTGVTQQGRFGPAGSEGSTLAANAWSTWGTFGSRDGFVLDFAFSSNTNGTAMGWVDIEVRQTTNTSNVLEPRTYPYNLTIGTAEI